jgi:hypothetical protein
MIIKFSHFIKIQPWSRQNLKNKIHSNEREFSLNAVNIDENKNKMEVFKMLLILEIVLTVAAWRKGWRGWALVPMVSVFVLALLIGAMAVASGSSEAELQELSIQFIFLDFICVGVLGWMTAKGRNKESHEVEKTYEQVGL